MQYNHTIDLDMMRRQSVEIVTHQYDDAGRAVRIRVLADGEPATLPENAQITYSVSKPDGTFCTGACTKEVDGEDTYVVFKLSYQMLILPGRETIDISIRADNASISTMTFINHIMRAAVQADDIESSSEFGQLEIALQGMDEIRDLKEDAEQAVVDAQAVVDGITSERTQITTNKNDIAQLKEDFILQMDEIPDTVQSYTFVDGTVSQITHNRSGVAIRTDVFTYGNNTITEVRTLNTGESLTIVTNLTTLETTVTYAAA